MKDFKITTIPAVIIYITGAAVMEYYGTLLAVKTVLKIVDKVTERIESKKEAK